MKIIAFEEHFKLPAIHHANKKANDPVELAYDTMIKSGRLVEDPKTGFPAGIYDLGEGRIAAMDDAGIDMQILSHTVPSTESLEPLLAKELSRQATTPWRLRSLSTRTGSSDLPHYQCSTPRLQRASSSAPCATYVSWAH
jgi:hypothetical protein